MTFLINLVQLLIFPGLLFCVVFGVIMAGIDRKLVARMQRRVGPPILQPCMTSSSAVQRRPSSPVAPRRRSSSAHPTWV